MILIFFSNEQRDNAIKFHNAIIINSLDDSVDYIVSDSAGAQKLSNDQKQGKTLYDEMDFCRNVIFTSKPLQDSCHDVNNPEDDDVEPEYNDESISVEMDVKKLVNKVKKIDENSIHSCLFIYEDDSHNPIIRCLFSYSRLANQILFVCRGLTDDSSDLPMTQYGLLDISENVMVAAFESYDTNPTSDQLYISNADSSDGQGFYEAYEPEQPFELSENSISVLTKLNEFQSECYFIDESDEGYYRVSDMFYKKHKKSLQKDESWVERGFCKQVYQAAESVLLTGQGWKF